MADNYTATQGTGTTFAADDVGGTLYPRLKLTMGADGVADMDVDSGQQVMASSLPVVLASDQDSIPVAATLQAGTALAGKVGIDQVTASANEVVIKSGTLTAVTAITNALPAGTNAIGKLAANSGVDIGDVDVTSLPTIPAGTNLIGKVGIDQTTPGTTNGVQVNAALPAGTNAIGKLAANSGIDIGDVDVTSIVPGTGATNLGKAEDAAHVSGDTGVLALAVRQAADTPLSDTDGDYEPLQTDASGFLKVNIKAGAGSGGTAIADDAAFTPGTTNVTPAAGTYRSVRDAVDDNDTGALAMTQKRALLACIETPAGDTAMDDTNDALRVNVVAGGGTGGTSSVDDAVFTAAAGSGTPIMGFATSDVVDAGDVGVIGMDTSRNLKVSIEVDNVGIGGGTQYAEDAAHVSGNIGTMALGVRKDTPANLSDTDGDYEPLQVSAGRLWTSSKIDTALPAGTNAIGKLAANSGVDIGDVDVTSLPVGTAAMVASTPVTLASDDTLTAAANALLTTIDADTSALAAAASGAEILIAGGATQASDIKVTLDSEAVVLGAGSAAIGKLAANSGVDIGDIDVTSIVPGTAATNLGKAEDAVHVSGDTGVLALAVRHTADTPLSDTDGDYEPLQTDVNGFLKVNIKAGAGSGGTASTDDAAFTAAVGSGTPMMGFATSDVVDAGDVGVVAMDVNRNLKVSIEADNAALSAGTNLIGKVGIDQTTPGTTNRVDIGAALPAGTNTIGATTDGGPAQTITHTYTTSADMTTAANISPAPTAGQKLVAMDIMVSVDTAMEFSVQEETSATVFASVFLPANSVAMITLRGFLKTAVADMHFQGKASVAGNVRVTMNSFSEA